MVWETESSHIQTLRVHKTLTAHPVAQVNNTGSQSPIPTSMFWFPLPPIIPGNSNHPCFTLFLQLFCLKQILYFSTPISFLLPPSRKIKGKSSLYLLSLSVTAHTPTAERWYHERVSNTRGLRFLVPPWHLHAVSLLKVLTSLVLNKNKWSQQRRWYCTSRENTKME